MVPLVTWAKRRSWPLAGCIVPDQQPRHERERAASISRQSRLSSELLGCNCHLRQVKKQTTPVANCVTILQEGVAGCFAKGWIERRRSGDGKCRARISKAGRAGLVYAGVIWCLIAYSRSSAFVFTFNVSIIRYL